MTKPQYLTNKSKRSAKQEKVSLVWTGNEGYIIYPAGLDKTQSKMDQAYKELWDKEVINYSGADPAKGLFPITKKEKNLKKGLKEAARNSVVGLFGVYAVNLLFGFTGSVITFLTGSLIPISVTTLLVSYTTIDHNINGKQKDSTIKLSERKQITIIHVYNRLKGEELVRYLNGN